jgi:hypothetical protein
MTLTNGGDIDLFSAILYVFLKMKITWSILHRTIGTAIYYCVAKPGMSHVRCLATAPRMLGKRLAPKLSCTTKTFALV